VVHSPPGSPDQGAISALRVVPRPSFAGDDIDQAVFYPDDDSYLVDRETTVTHYQVARRA
jgi:hypothetical protein